jgi:hypothetical protein
VDDLLKISLSAAVPLWIAELKGLPWKDVSRMAGEAATIVASQGDTLMYKTKGKTREAFNALARGLAILSFAPGGVKFADMHFESRHEEGEQSSGNAIPRDLTFEKGTMGRFVLKHRLRLEFQEVPDPRPGRWAKGARHYIVRVIDGKGRELNSSFTKGALLEGPPAIEEVLYSMAMDSVMWEQSRGSIDDYANETAQDPDDVEAQYGFAASETVAAGLRVLLGREGYQELLALTGKSR